MKFLSCFLAMLLFFYIFFCTRINKLWANETYQIMAIVSSQLITSLDVEKIIIPLEQQLLASSHLNEQKLSLDQLRQLALEYLIEDKLLELEAKYEKINISEEELERFIKEIKPLNKFKETELAIQLNSNKLTIEQYREELKKKLIKYKLLENNIKRKVVISDEQVDKTYAEIYSNVHDSKQVRFRSLFLQLSNTASYTTEQTIKEYAEILRNEAINGANFTELIQKYSPRLTIALDDGIKSLSTSDMLPIMRTALAELEPGDITPVIKIPSGYIIIQLLERDNYSTSLPSLQIKKQLREKLENEAIEKRSREWIKELRANYYVKIMN